MNHYFLIGFIAYLVLINILSFAAMGMDKGKAEHHSKSRLPEALFLELVGVGGGIGVIIAVFVFHHKIRNTWFLLGVPVVVVFQAALVVCAYFAGAH